MLDDKFSNLSPNQQYILHEDMTYGFRPQDIIGVFEHKMFVLDARAQVDLDAVLNGFVAERDCIIRFTLLDDALYPIYTQPTHNAYRFPELCAFVPPTDIPVRILMLEQYEDATLMRQYRNITHHNMRILNLPDYLAERLERQQSLFFAEGASCASIAFRTGGGCKSSRTGSS